MKLILGIVGYACIAGHLFAQLPKVTEQTIDLKDFGFKSGSCDSRQTAYFLDDSRLILSAPSVGICDKSNWSSALPTQFTVIDLHGAVLSTKTRSDVYATKAGPIGYVAVCTESSLELVSGDLGTARVISTRPNSDIDGLSPSRTAISVRDFGDSPKSFARHRLIQANSEKPIAEQQFGKGDSLAGITDSGYAVCTSVGHHGCEQLMVDGSAWAVGIPEGTSHHQGLFLSPNQLLLPPLWRTEKTLMSLFRDGKQEQVVNLRGYQPPNVDNPSVQISATTPRRISTMQVQTPSRSFHLTAIPSWFSTGPSCIFI